MRDPVSDTNKQARGTAQQVKALATELGNLWYLWDPRGRRRESIATSHPLTPTQAGIHTHHCPSPQYTDKIGMRMIKKDTWHWPLTFAHRYTRVETDLHAHLHKPTPTPLEGS